MNNKEFPPNESFFSVLRNSNPLEKDYNDFQKLVNSGLTTEQAVTKLRMDTIPPTGAENYSSLQSVWENNNLHYFSDFLKWYNNKDVVPTLEAMQKMIEFFHNSGIDTLKLGCTLPNLANICLHRSTDSKFYPFTESDKDLLEKIREGMVSGPSIVVTRKAVVDEILYANHQTCANQLLVSMVVSFIPTQYVNQCLLDCIRDGSTMQKPRDSQLVKTNLAPLRI